MKIYAHFGKHNEVVDTCRNQQEAERKISKFMREDRYSVETEKYPMPLAWEGAYPTYTFGR